MQLKDISKSMENARSEMTDRAFQNAAGILSETKSNIREDIQEKTAGDIKGIINKLESNETLSSEDISMVKLWIIGDAESYINMENNFNDWLEEFKRLETVISNHEGQELSGQDLFKFQGILEDAVRTSYDISNFLEKKERIQKFETSASDGLDQDEQGILAGILKRKLQSEDW